MLYPGAGSATQDQLQAVLGIESLAPVADLAEQLASREELGAHQKMLVEGSLTRQIDPEALRFRLAIANALWVQTGYSLEQAYIDTLTESLGAGPESVDFAQAPEDACARVNQWVSDKTAGRIGAILSPQALSPLTRAIVANAIYFKARWAKVFSRQNTRDAPFTCLDGSRAIIPTMHRTGYYAYAADEDVQMIELPYINADIVMDIILPRRGRFAAVERVLSMAYVFTLIGELNQSAFVDLHLPRFRIESDLRLGKALVALGLGEVFSSSADFTAMSAEPGFHIDEVLHKTFVEVDELGTEAAAVTMPMTVGAGLPPEPIAMRVDRPFWFFIRDVPSQAILFFGRMGHPLA